MKVMRATELWQQAGAFYVRIQAMGRKYHIPLYKEFDVHDTPVTKYIVILDDDFPVATCRFFRHHGAWQSGGAGRVSRAWTGSAAYHGS